MIAIVFCRHRYSQVPQAGREKEEEEEEEEEEEKEVEVFMFLGIAWHTWAPCICLVQQRRWSVDSSVWPGHVLRVRVAIAIAIAIAIAQVAE